MERFGSWVIPVHSGLVISDYGDHEGGVTVCGVQHVLFYGYDPEIKSFRHFSYNENLTRGQNTTSLKCCLP